MAGVGGSWRPCQNPRRREGAGGPGLRSGAGCGLDVLGGKEKREEGSMDFHVGDWGVGRWGGGRKGWRRKGCEELESK